MNFAGESLEDTEHFAKKGKGICIVFGCNGGLLAVSTDFSDFIY